MVDTIVSPSARKIGDRFTLEQWRLWPEGERWELIAGEAFNMSPAPRYSHQKVLGQLAYALMSFLAGKPCVPLIAPLDVFLNDDETVVQPDVMVVCRQEIIQEDGIHGAPDFVAEILSDSTAYKDIGAKRIAYAKAGVGEYWVVHPLTRVITVFRLDGQGSYGKGEEYLPDQLVASTVIKGFTWSCAE